MVDLVDTIDELSDAILAVGKDANIIAWSLGAEKLLGYSAKSVTGKRCGDILQGIYPSGEPMCTSRCEARSCLKKGESFLVETCLLRHLDGHMVPARLISIQMPSAAGKTNPEHFVEVIFLQQSQSAEPATSRNQLRIFTLGHFSLVHSGKGLAVDNWKRKQALTLLKYLVGKVDHPVHRDQLIEQLWPDAQRGRGWDSLKVAISFLRNQLQQSGVAIDPVLTLGQSYMLRGDAVWIDAREFVKLVSAGHRLLQDDRLDEALSSFEDANRLYNGDFLEDDPYTDWSIKERERLRECYFDMLAGMAKCQAAKGDHWAAARSCQTALYRDQSRESFLRSLIDSLGKVDQSEWEKPQLDIWQRVLDKEFDIVPKPEHLQIYEELIRAARDDPDAFE